MRYTFLLYSDPAMAANMTEEDWAKSKEVYGQYIGALQEAGVFMSTPTGCTLRRPPQRLRLAGGEKQVQDGPFAETKETLGGFFAIDVENLDEAMKWAEKCPHVHYGKLEIRASAMGSV